MTSVMRSYIKWFPNFFQPRPPRHIKQAVLQPSSKWKVWNLLDSFSLSGSRHSAVAWNQRFPKMQREKCGLSHGNIMWPSVTKWHEPSLSFSLTSHFPICLSFSLKWCNLNWAICQSHFTTHTLARTHTSAHTNTCYDAKQASKLCKGPLGAER